jgi:hypothetical protein
MGNGTIGIAGGNSSTKIAHPVATVSEEPLKLALENIKEVIQDHDATGIVVGWHLNDDGSENSTGTLDRRIANVLALSTGLDVRLWYIMPDDAVYGGKNQGSASAAALQSFFNNDGASAAPRPDEITDCDDKHERTGTAQD